MSTAAVAYTLLTVTFGGTVGHTDGFKSLATCRDAASLALTGQTVAAYKAEDDFLNSKRQRRADEWNKAHPPRKPANASERDFAKTDGCLSYSYGLGLCSDGKGSVFDEPPLDQNGWSGIFNANEGEGAVEIHGEMIVKHREDDKIAECVIEP